MFGVATSLLRQEKRQHTKPPDPKIGTTFEIVYKLSRMKKISLLVRYALFLLALCMSPLSAFAAGVADQTVYLYRSALTSTYVGTGNTTYEDGLAFWRRNLRKYRKNFQIIDRTQLLGKLNPGVLVLASAQVLDSAELSAIREFAKAGGGLLATGATGSRDASGKFIGYGFVEGQFNLRVRAEHYQSDSDWFLMPFGDGPLTWSLPAGRRIYVGKDGADLLRIESGNLAGVVMNWDREKDDIGTNGAIAFDDADNRRGVYFAFPEAALGYHTPSEIAQIIDNVIGWLRHEPKLFKSAWPDAHVAAHLMEMDTEDRFFSAPNFANHLEKIGAKGTFYCLMSEAIKYPNVVKDLLARGHEIGYHADVHVGFKNEPAAVQEKRILSMKRQMQIILGDASTQATGFRAPTESYDEATEILLRRSGILHHAADPSSHENRLPFFSTAEPALDSEQALVVLPRTQYDDVSFKKLGFNVERVQETMAYDLDLIVKSGAFGLLSVHTQNYVDGGLMRIAMEKYVDVVASYKDRLWVARGDRIAAWWRKRQLVSVKQSLAEDNTITMRVSVKSPGNVDGLTVFVINANKGQIPTVRSLSDKAVKIKIKPIDAFRTALIFEKLNAGEVEYVVRFP